MAYVLLPFTTQDDLDPIITAWQAAFATVPNHWRGRQELWDQLAFHGGFPGFTGFVARDTARDTIAGVVYGFRNAPGQWWRDRVARSLGAERTLEILDDSFCLMELGVLPDARRFGVARLLVQGLLAAQPHPRALLSVESHNEGARRFYLATGWQVLLARMSFGPGFLPYDIMLTHVLRQQ
jgi:ribosomal protein S18 acetylase RimI-like enzyme